jgi:4-diphosphocytidyl-2-C-methyl-D-erythritol kinase
MTGIDAPAKINLALHVTGRRADGFHLIESLVVFTELGDRLLIETSSSDVFRLEGQESQVLAGEDAGNNLVVRARDMLRAEAMRSARDLSPVQICLEKRLPVASGIGGGSADAAAALKLLCQHWDYHPGAETLSRIALDLGADVPMCLDGRPLIARGIGEALTPVELGFSLDMVIVNPRVGVSTPKVFHALECRENPPLPQPQGLGEREQFIAWLRQARNDLQPAAQRMVPDISRCLSALEKAGTRMARMSGSGASCFGLFADAAEALAAAEKLKQDQPDWFIAATRTLTATR